MFNTQCQMAEGPSRYNKKMFAIHSRYTPSHAYDLAMPFPISFLFVLNSTQGSLKCYIIQNTTQFLLVFGEEAKAEEQLPQLSYRRQFAHPPIGKHLMLLYNQKEPPHHITISLVVFHRASSLANLAWRTEHVYP